MGTEMFLYDRAFDDCLDRLRDIPRNFEQALLIGCPSPSWVRRLHERASSIVVLDPGELFAASAGGTQVEEDRYDFGNEQFDLCVAIGTLDTVNDLPPALQRIRNSLKPESPLIGAIAGGNVLPALRTSLIEAGRVQGRVLARTHPRIEASSLAQLLVSAGFTMPVVDIDRVRLGYPDLSALVRDLRGMGATSVLAQRSPPFTKAELNAAATEFTRLGNGGRTEEIVEILHFHAWRQ